MTPTVRTSAPETEIAEALLSLVQSHVYTEDYSITSVTTQSVAITDSNGEINLIPCELIHELSVRAFIPYETAFDLIATLTSKRNPGDMAIEIILPLLENRTIEEVKEIISEYGDSAGNYLIDIITVDDDDTDAYSADSLLSIHRTKETIRADIDFCREELRLMKTILSCEKSPLHMVQIAKNISGLKETIKRLQHSLKS